MSPKEYAEPSVANDRVWPQTIFSVTMWCALSDSATLHKLGARTTMLLVSISAPLSMAFLFMSLRDCVPLEESPGQRMVRSAENMAATAKKSLVTYAKLRAKAEKNNQDGRFNRFLEELKEDEAQCRQILELAEQIKALGGRKLPVPLRP